MGRLVSMALTSSPTCPRRTAISAQRVNLKYVEINPLNNTHLYYSTVKRCRECSQKSRCTRGKYRTITIHTCEPARQRARALAETPAFAISQRARRKAEALFAELKNCIRLCRLRLRRMRFVREQ